MHATTVLRMESSLLLTPYSTVTYSLRILADLAVLRFRSRMGGHLCFTVPCLRTLTLHRRTTPNPLQGVLTRAIRRGGASPCQHFAWEPTRSPPYSSTPPTESQGKNAGALQYAQRHAVISSTLIDHQPRVEPQLFRAGKIDKSPSSSTPPVLLP